MIYFPGAVGVCAYGRGPLEKGRENRCSLRRTALLIARIVKSDARGSLGLPGLREEAARATRYSKTARVDVARLNILYLHSEKKLFTSDMDWIFLIVL